MSMSQFMYTIMLQNIDTIYFHAFQSFFRENLADQLHNTGVSPKGCVVRLEEQRSRYIQTTCAFPGQPRMTFYAHRLVYQLQNQLLSLPIHLEVSHLCHNTKCVRIDHLNLETKEVNDDRRHCKNQGVCTRDHLPHCIF